MPDRWVIPHLDDLGASHGANAAYAALHRQGFVTCGAVMIPGAWFRELVEICADGTHDVGVHLTLTSEWRACRWAPVSTVSRTSGLIDDDGYFWPDLASLRRHMVLEAAEIELRAQVERAVAAGLRPTHCDSHMAAAMLPGLLEAQLRLAGEFGLVPVLPRSIAWAPDLDAYRRVVAELDGRAIDHCIGTIACPPGELKARWAAALDALAPGVTHLALHATAPGDFAAAAPDHAVWREAEFAFLHDGRLHALCTERGIGILGTRDFREE